MKFLYVFLIALLLLADIFAYTEATTLIRQASDASVTAGFLLLALLIVINFFVIRFLLYKIKA